MRYSGIAKKSALIVLAALVLLAAASGSLSLYKVAAADLPISEKPPLPTIPEADYVPDQIIVKFKPGFFIQTADGLNESLGTSVIHTSPRGGFKVLKILQGKTVAEMVDIYLGQAIVEYAEPNYLAHITWSPDDTLYDLQWHFYNATYGGINMEAAWGLDTTAPNYGGDSSIVVAVIDTGVAYETYSPYVIAPDLGSTNFWVNTGETPGNSIDDDSNGYTDDINGWDFVNGDAHPNDDHQHGTHVTGTIAQSTNNDLGVAGIAFNTTIMPLKVLDPSWSGGPPQWRASGSNSDIADAIYYAADNGADIINMSLGSSSSSSMIEDAVAYASNAGVVIVASSGNTGNTTAQYPASYDDYVISVGATRYDEARSYYSSYGSHLDIVAPGGDTSVNQNGDAFVDGVVQQTLDAPSFPDPVDPTAFSYWFFQGTSMAAPHVAGVAALILANNPGWTPAQVRHALESTADDLGTSGWDSYFGWGLIDAYDAVNSSLATATSYKDSGHNTETNDFSDYGTEHTVYMYFTGLHPSYTYRVAYYDGDDNKVATDDVSSDSSGNLSSEHAFADGSDAAGTWNAVVSDRAHTPPSNYNSTWSYMITEDTFTVQASAIPEFPTALAAMVAMAISAGLYLWMRKKSAPVPA